MISKYVSHFVQLLVSLLRYGGKVFSYDTRTDSGESHDNNKTFFPQTMTWFICCWFFSIFLLIILFYDFALIVVSNIDFFFYDRKSLAIDYLLSQIVCQMLHMHHIRSQCES